MVTTISLPVCQRFSDILQKLGRSLFTKEEENFAVGNVTGKLEENTKDWETCASKNFFGAMHLSPKSWTIGDHSYYYDYYLGGRKWLLHYTGMKVGENGSLRPSLKSSNCVFCSLTFAIERPKKGERTHNVCRVQGSKIKKNEKEKKKRRIVCVWPSSLPFVLYWNKTLKSS